jgi:hypothetical protein
MRAIAIQKKDISKEFEFSDKEIIIEERRRILKKNGNIYLFIPDAISLNTMLLMSDGTTFLVKNE